MPDVGTLTAYIKLQHRQFSKGLQQVQQEVKDTASKVEDSTTKIDTMSSSFAKVSSTAKLFKGSLAAIAITYFSKSVYHATLELEAMRRTMEFATGSSRVAAETLDWVRQKSDEIGISYAVSAREFGKLIASARGSTVTLEQLKVLYEAIAKNTAILGLDTHKTSLIFLAFQQMLSKGKVVSQEVRTQIGEHIPGAFQIFSDAIGVTTEQFEKLMSTGKLGAAEVIPLVAKVMNETATPAMQTLGTSSQAALNRMLNAWQDMKDAIVDSGGAELVRLALVGIRKALMAINKIGTSVAQLFRLLFDKRFWTQTNLDELKKDIEGINTNLSKTQEKVVKTTVSFTKAEEAVRNSFRAMETSTQDISKIVQEQYGAALGTVQKGLERTADLLYEMATTGKANFKTLINSMVADLYKLVMQLLVIKPIMGMFTSLLGGNASGGKGMLGILGFATGGIIKEPVIGTGLNSGSTYAFGESGPEMVTPVSVGGGGNERPSEVNVVIQALDSQSVVELMQNNPGAIIEPLTRALQSGDRGLTVAIRGAL